MNHLQKTQETYRKIAADYALKWHQRGAILPELDKFAALLPAGATMLDVGCGPGLDSAVLQDRNFTVIGLDYSYEMMRVGRDEHDHKLSFCQADMRHLPIGRQVDGIWASASLLHLQREDLLPTMQGFWRVLKPGGLLYLSVKLGQGAKWVHADKYEHDLERFFTFWQPETIDPLLETAAFQIIVRSQETGHHDEWLVRMARKQELEVGR